MKRETGSRQKRAVTAIALCLIFSLASLGAIEVHVDQSVSQGSILTVAIEPNRDLLSIFESSSGLRSVEVELIAPNGNTHSRTEAFMIDDAPGMWFALLGVSSTAATGPYTVRVRFLSDRFGVEERKSVDVYPGVYSEMRIALGRSLTSLLTEPDQQRLDEARELQRILFTVRSSAVYHTDVFVMPVEARRISAQFGDRRTYEYADGRESTSVHWGVDFAAATGTEAAAAGAGRVVLSRDRILSGRTVIIEHLPGVYTLYYHLDSLAVSENQMVNAGDLIGEVGMTGLATGPHLHWELRVAGQAVAPLRFLEEPLLDTAEYMGTMSP
ncbi:MAG: M23 family metallopeptidase [Spirochaetaceae bacterium]|nr:MAG: M23 family metallopeptidase [Spirochaetaceae bacterium]